MPCTEPSRSELESYGRMESSKLKTTINDLTKKKKWLEGALCALISHLTKLNFDVDIILIQAGQAGDVDLPGFWSKHKRDDRDSMNKRLESFSEDELRLIRTILNEGDL